MKHLLPQIAPKTLRFATSFAEEIAPLSTDTRFTLEQSNGPAMTWIGPANTGISGAHTLKVSGRVENGGCYSAVLFDGLSIPVTADTKLCYHLFPAMHTAHYDHSYTGMYFAIDLTFTDGSALSSLGAIDQNGTALTPVAQGESRILFTNQWNQVICDVGEVASGKIIEQIVLRYEKESGKGTFETYFDDFSIYDQADTVYTRPCHYINPLRGTNDSPAFSRGLTTPAILTPQGFNMYAPCTNYGGSKHYDYLSHTMSAITISHEPSIWIGDRGTWQFMVNTSLEAGRDERFDTRSQQNFFSHEDELALAHYYRLSFDEEGGDAADSALEMTPTSHGVCVRFTYNESVAAHSVLFDCQNADGGINFGTDNSFTAFSDHSSNGSGRVFIYGEFSTKPTSVATRGRCGIASFAENAVEMRFATSYISYAQAKHNYALELAGRSFEEICTSAADEWDSVLACISGIKGATEGQLETIYSGLYYLYKYPNTIAENIGTNESTVMKYRSPYTKKVEEGDMVINNGFWDTYRTCWAGYALFSPEKLPALLDGFIKHYEDQGLVPRWSAPGGVNCMVGTSSDVIFSDAAVKGFDFKIAEAYESAIKNACVYSPSPKDGGRELLDRSIFLGYTPGSGEHFSWSMEGYINDYGIAQMAKVLYEREIDPEKKQAYLAEYRYFMNRAKNYTLLFWSGGEGVENKWFRGRNADGSLHHANDHDGVFDPLFWGNDFTETDAYNMTVSVPFDGQGLANLYGGRDALAGKIDSIFETYDVYRGYGAQDEHGGIHEQREAREMKLGRYGHSNQPSHHIIYMYDFCEPSKAQKYSRDVTRRLYNGGRFGQGFPGDEDNGEMSTWFIFSALGFYPLSMGSGEYAIGSPLFEEVSVNFGSKTLHIVAQSNSPENIYVQSLTLNGVSLDRTYLTHDEIKEGGELIFTMGATPSDWGRVAPTSLTEGDAPATPAIDLAVNGIKIAVGDKCDSDAVDADRITTTIAGISALIDNTSKTDGAIKASDSITYSFTQPKRAELFTLTSSFEPENVAKVTLFAAENGGDWVELCSYSNVEFRWAQYTRPFLTGADRAYHHYKLVFDKAVTLAEIELLG